MWEKLTLMVSWFIKNSLSPALIKDGSAIVDRNQMKNIGVA